MRSSGTRWRQCLSNVGLGGEGKYINLSRPTVSESLSKQWRMRAASRPDYCRSVWCIACARGDVLMGRPLLPGRGAAQHNARPDAGARPALGNMQPRYGVWCIFVRALEQCFVPSDEARSACCNVKKAAVERLLFCRSRDDGLKPTWRRGGRRGKRRRSALRW